MKHKLLLALLASLRRAFAGVHGAEERINWLVDHAHQADTTGLNAEGEKPPPTGPPTT